MAIKTGISSGHIPSQSPLPFENPSGPQADSCQEKERSGDDNQRGRVGAHPAHEEGGCWCEGENKDGETVYGGIGAVDIR